MNEPTNPNCSWIKARVAVAGLEDTKAAMIDRRPNCMNEPTNPDCTWIRAVKIREVKARENAPGALTNVGSNTAPYDEAPHNGPNCMNEPTNPSCTWIKARSVPVQSKEGEKNPTVVLEGPLSSIKARGH